MYSGIPENALRDGGDTAKGFLVPDIYKDKLVEALRDANFLRSIGTVLNTTKDLHIPVVMKNGDAQWIGETERYCNADIEFGEIVLGAHKLGTMTLLSEELLADFGIDLEAYIAQEYKERIAISEEEAFLVGDGIGKSLGLVHQTEVGATTEQSGKISMSNITPHVCRHTYCSNMARAGMNPKTLQYLMGHSDIGVTMNTYTHLGLEDSQNEMVRLEELNRAKEEVARAAGEQRPVTQRSFRAV